MRTWKKKQVFGPFVDEMAEGQGSPGSASAGVLTGEEVLSRLAVAVDRLAQSTAAHSAGSAVSEWRESKHVKQPEVFSPKSIDEEIAGWQEWSFVFKNFMSVQDERFREDFTKAETASSFVAFESYEAETRARALRLYSVLASYLKGRPLKMLKSVTNGDGSRVWRQLTEELQPATRPRALALAQALVRFPPLKDGGSVLEYTLLYERLIAEYEKVSATKYPDDRRLPYADPSSATRSDLTCKASAPGYLHVAST